MFLLYFCSLAISDMLDEIEWHHGPSLVALRDGPLLLRHKAGQEGRGEILLENSFMR